MTWSLPKSAIGLRVARLKTVLAHFFLGGRRDVDVEPKRSRGAEKRDDRERKANPGNADAVGAKRDQFVVRREPAEDEQHGREQAPRDREDERERQDVGDEADHVFDRQIVIDEQRQELAEDVADDENEAEHGNREKEIHDKLAADVAVDQFHRMPFVSSVPATWQVALGDARLQADAPRNVPPKFLFNVNIPALIHRHAIWMAFVGPARVRLADSNRSSCAT